MDEAVAFRRSLQLILHLVQARHHARLVDAGRAAANSASGKSIPPYKRNRPALTVQRRAVLSLAIAQCASGSGRT
jgi:hypothetical protein